MSMMQQETTLQSVKKKVYMYVLPIGFIACAVDFVFGMSIGTSETVNRISSPVIGIWLLVSFILLLSNSPLFAKSEEGLFWLVGAYYNIKFYTFLAAQYTGRTEYIDGFALWMPLVFIILFLVFERTKALTFSLALLAVNVMGVVVFIIEDRLSLEKARTVLQLLLSNVSYVVFLSVMEKFKYIFFERSLLNKMAYTDYLTNLPNRRSIERTIDEQLQQSASSHQLWVVIFDIDHFKHINDVYGHQVGDTVLQQLAELVKRDLSEHEVVGRWGGEEFIFVINNMDYTEMRKRIERLKHEIESHVFPVVSHVTASFGATLCFSEDTTRDILKRADDALYAAKRNGRNQICVANEELLV
jgi:diguanylate cyclase (GGDEF)-like protein